MFVLLCGMESEAQVFLPYPNLQILFGTARNNLAQYIPKDCKGLISAGTAGGLDSRVKRGDLIVANAVVTIDEKIYAAHPPWAASVINKTGGAIGRLFSSPNEITQTPAQRIAVSKKYNAIADDEESWAVAETALKLGLPFIVLRAISDQSDQTLLPDDTTAVNPDGSINVIKEIPDFFEDPGEAILEATGLEQALITLKNTFDRLGNNFAFP